MSYWTKKEVELLKKYRMEGMHISEIADKLDRSYDSIKHALQRYGIKNKQKTNYKIFDCIEKTDEEKLEEIVEKTKKIFSNKWQIISSKKKIQKKNFKSYLVIADLHIPYQNDSAIKAVLQLMEDIIFDGFIILGDYMDMTPISHWLHEKNQRKSLEGMRMKEDYVIGNMLLDEFDKRLPKKCDKIFLYGNHERFYYDFVEKYPVLEGLFDPTIELHLKERGYTVHDGLNPIFRIGRLSFTHGMYHNKHFLHKHINEFKTNVLIGHLHTSRLRLENSPVKEIAVFGGSIGCLCDLNPDYNRNRPNKMSHGFGVVYFYKNGFFDVDIKRIVKGKFVFNGKLYNGNE